MHTHTRLIISICLVLVFQLGAPAESLAIDDAIIAVVNDELITLKDLKDYVQSTYVGLVAEGMSDREIEAIMRDLEINGTMKLIEDKLIISKAKAVGMEVREELIDNRIEELKQKYGSEQKLIDALIETGATLSDLRKKIRDQLMIKFFINHEVRSGIYVNPQEVTNYYENNKEKFSVEDRVNLKSIFIKYQDNKTESLAKAVEAFKYATGDNDFDTLIKKYSDAPSVGIIRRGQFLPDIEKVIFGLKIEGISPMIEVANGIYIFKLIGAMPAGTADLNDVKDSIYDQLFSQKFKNAFMRWLDDLKKDAYIEIKQ